MDAPLQVCTPDEQRSVLRFLRSEGTNLTEIHYRMFLQYGDKCLSAEEVYKWAERFDNGQTSVLDQDSMNSFLDVVTNVLQKRSNDQHNCDDKLLVEYLAEVFQAEERDDFMENNGDRKVTFDTPPIARLSLGRPPFPANRKLSFPASLHANLLGIANPLKHEDKPEHFNAKRRFSNVSDAVSRKLSNTIGWRIPNVPPEEVIAQGRVLCGQYIRNRLKRSGIFSKKLGLYRLRSMVGTSSAIVVREVFPGLVGAGIELERMYPKVYSNVARQASHTPGGVLVSDKAAAGLLAAIGHDLLKSDINWGKVVSIFAVAGGLAVDCVCQGHPEYLHGLLEGMVEILEDDLGDWIASNGGWTGLSHQCRTEDDEVTVIEYVSLIVIIVSLLLICYFIVRVLIKVGVL